MSGFRRLQRTGACLKVPLCHFTATRTHRKIAEGPRPRSTLTTKTVSNSSLLKRPRLLLP